MSDICLFVSTEEFDPVSIAIRLKTECAWSHVGFYRVSDNMTFSAMCDGKGVAWRSVKLSQRIMLLSVEGKDYNGESYMDLAFRAALTQEGRPYNLLDITGIALGFNWCSSNQWICSAMVLWAFEQADYSLLNPVFIPRQHLTPRDVLLSPKLSGHAVLGVSS